MEFKVFSILFMFLKYGTRVHTNCTLFKYIFGGIDDRYKIKLLSKYFYFFFLSLNSTANFYPSIVYHQLLSIHLFNSHINFFIHLFIHQFINALLHLYASMNLLINSSIHLFIYSSIHHIIK